VICYFFKSFVSVAERFISFTFNLFPSFHENESPFVSLDVTPVTQQIGTPSVLTALKNATKDMM